MLVRIVKPLVALILSATATASVWAQAEYTFKFNASYSLMSDSNLFRLPASTNFNAVLGKSSAY